MNRRHFNKLAAIAPVAVAITVSVFGDNPDNVFMVEMLKVNKRLIARIAPEKSEQLEKPDYHGNKWFHIKRTTKTILDPHHILKEFSCSERYLFVTEQPASGSYYHKHAFRYVANRSIANKLIKNFAKAWECNTIEIRSTDDELFQPYENIVIDELGNYRTQQKIEAYFIEGVRYYES